MRKQLLALLIGISLLSGTAVSKACTNFLITPGASTDGSSMITYAADSHTLYGALHLQPAADYQEGEVVNIIEQDTGKPLGQIPQVSHTYHVVGNMNEFQVAIGETTFGGRKELQSQAQAIMDYGSLMWLALQRSKTAREAIQVITDLVARYGYASSGESFSISDPNECWILEMIGKGESELGAVWVAYRIPDGYISGHANQARITQFPMNDPENCIYSKDVISFAIENGWFNGKNKEFSFADVYAPIDFEAARFCEARVWSGFNKVNSEMGQYMDYATGQIEYDEKGYPSNRFPLWIKPDARLSVQDVMDMMRDHYEGTKLDMTNDPGAGPYKLPYRWRPLTWQVDSIEYCNERAISTQQTGFSFVAQSRSNFANEVGGVLWFGVDDTYSTCYTPLYCCMQEVPQCFMPDNGDMLTFSNSSAFWIFNMVSNFTYLRYDIMIEDVKKVQSELETRSLEWQPAMEMAAVSLINSGKKERAIELLSDYSVNQANNMTQRWKQLFRYLLVKYKDGNVMKEENGEFKRTKYNLPPSPFQPGYPEWWYQSIINHTGDHHKIRK